MIMLKCIWVFCSTSNSAPMGSYMIYNNDNYKDITLKDFTFLQCFVKSILVFCPFLKIMNARFFPVSSESSAGEYLISGNINKVEHYDKKLFSHLGIRHLNLKIPKSGTLNKNI